MKIKKKNENGYGLKRYENTGVQRGAIMVPGEEEDG